MIKNTLRLALFLLSPMLFLSCGFNNNDNNTDLSAILASPTVAAFHFNEGSGSSTYDSSPYHLRASITGATWVQGKSGTALSFATGTAETNVNYTYGYLDSSKLSVQAWLHPNSTCAPGTTCLIVGDAFSWLLQLNGGTIEFWINYGLGSDWAKVASSTVPIGTNAWHQVAATYNGERAVLYIDGVVDTDNPGPVYTVSGDDQTIAIGGSDGCCRYMNTVSSFPGIIDDVQISKVELSAAEIANDYNATK